MEVQGRREERRREEKQQEEEKKLGEGKGRGGKKKIKLWDLCLQNGQFVKQLRVPWEVCDTAREGALAGAAPHRLLTEPFQRAHQGKWESIV